MGLAIFCLILGFIVGYLLRDSRQEKPKETIQKTRNVYLNYNERQREKSAITMMRTESDN
jgi:sugar phosphate permease